MKAAMLSGSGPANGFNKVTIYKKQDAASGLVSLAITWEMDSMKVKAEQDFYLNISNAKKSIDGKSYIVSFYSDKALTQVAGNIVSKITTSQLPSIKETYQSLNTVMNFSANTNIPKGALVLNTLASGSISSSILPLAAKSTLTSGILSGGLADSTLVKVISNGLSSNVVKFKIQVNKRPSSPPIKTRKFYIDGPTITSLNNQNISKFNLYDNLELSGSPKGLIIFNKTPSISPNSSEYIGTNVDCKVLLYKSNSDSTSNTFRFTFGYNQYKESLQDVLKSLTNLTTNSISGSIAQISNKAKLSFNVKENGAKQGDESSLLIGVLKTS